MFAPYAPILQRSFAAMVRRPPLLAGTDVPSNLVRMLAVMRTPIPADLRFGIRISGHMANIERPKAFEKELERGLDH